ncbi:amino-acid N-acetyltransferase [Duganella sp. 1411]|uniref:arsenic resistance N-acetyltransferase ArsN2 n=1 Tax=Duganella sp. 1411 TaxID=2806572 RepID=UPI001AE6B1AF|nr:arsenic resistance N-acetyltransferase ArsN2 [Duganella sp. 1411]MBP1202358.1 amino-acid N-acetyltransferase [Duganella sp. 1411]
MSSMQAEFPTFRPATPADWPTIETLLTEAGLPREGAHDHLAGFLVGEAGGAIVCAGALEHYGAAALLRSVVVVPDRQGSGIGGHLFDALKAIADARGIGKLYLLTTTAATFFARRGFSEDARAAVPAAVLVSREFQGACPASATLMSCSLRDLHRAA